MVNYDRSPAWFRDAKWLSGLLLVLALAAATLFFSLAQLTARQRALPLIESVLQLTLLPEGLDGPAVTVRQGIDYQPGEPLQLLPGVEVYADATEIPTFSIDAARNRIAGVLADSVISRGAAGALALVSNPEFTAQLERAFAQPVPLMVRAHLMRQLLPSGLADGSRLANWRLQAQRNPGQEVQPVVGVFVFVQPEELLPLSEVEIGQLVVDRLADTVLIEGLPSAQEAISNANLLTRLTDAVDRELRLSLHELFVTLLLGREETMMSRLEQAQAAIIAQGAPPEGIAGVVPAEALEGLSPREANEVVLAALAERAYEGGSAVLAEVVTDEQQAARLASVTTLVDALTADAHGRYLRWTWLLGIASGLLLLGLIVFSSGWGRLANPGIAVALAAGVGAFMFSRFAGSLRLAEVPPPSSLRTEGAFAYLAKLIGYVSTAMPFEALELLLRNHLIVAGVGGGLIALSLLIRLGRLLRPRRRSLI